MWGRWEDQGQDVIWWICGSHCPLTIDNIWAYPIHNTSQLLLCSLRICFPILQSARGKRVWGFPSSCTLYSIFDRHAMDLSLFFPPLVLTPGCLWSFQLVLIRTWTAEKENFISDLSFLSNRASANTTFSHFLHSFDWYKWGVFRRSYMRGKVMGWTVWQWKNMRKCTIFCVLICVHGATGKSENVSLVNGVF